MKRNSFLQLGSFAFLGLSICLLSPQAGNAQNASLTELAAYQSPGKTWSIAGDVEADLGKENILKASKGTGILVNLPDKKNHGIDLISTMEHGDAELELDYMLAKGSNSGVYLQGRYEIQLLDSWSVKNPKAGDNGGVYERWDDKKPVGLQGFEGYAPRQNASRAPGLWQKLRVSFQAPKFDATGKKTANARLLRVELNGVTIHENVELMGATRGAMGEEKATGPLRFQGDHGAVAFRNITLTPGIRNRQQGGGGGNDPILVDAQVNTVLRSFMDMPGQPRVVHAVSVGSPEKVHYTYDLDNGAVIQVWRGGFLDATPMWNNRGDGSSRPLGMVQRFGKPAFSIAKLSSPQAAWTADTTGSGYRPKGYFLDENDRPTFQYRVFGTMVSDAIRVMDNGQGIRRVITVQNPSGDLYARLAEGTTIEDKGKGMYIIDGKSYYLQVEESNAAKPTVRDANGRKELIMPVKGTVSYSVIF